MLEPRADFTRALPAARYVTCASAVHPDGTRHRAGIRRDLNVYAQWAVIGDVNPSAALGQGLTVHRAQLGSRLSISTGWWKTVGP